MTVRVVQQSRRVQVVQQSAEVERFAQGPRGPQGEPGPDTSIALTAHEIDPSPHSAYDDMPSTYLIFENGLI